MSTVTVETATGVGRLHWFPSATPVAVLVLGGGASGQVHTPDLDALARELPPLGVSVALFELPWRVAGKRMGPRPPASDPAWLDGQRAARALDPSVPLLSGGRSAGARIACRTWTPEVAAVVALSFPLHPPGHPDRSRADEMRPVAAPVLVASGARDPFGTVAEWRAELDNGHAGPRPWVEVVGATHSFPERTTAPLVDAVGGFVLRVVHGEPV